MKGSYYSNMGTSKVSTKFIDETCLQHEGEPFTNFCSANTCIKPLCPQCIENHYSHHKNIRTPPQIESFRTLKNKCTAKIAEILEQVGGEQTDSSVNELHAIFEESLRRVREVREQCKKLSDSYFNNLEDFIRKKMSRITSEQSDLLVEMDRVSNIIAELRLLLNKIDNHKSFLITAETIIKLDSDKIEEKVKEGLFNIRKFKESHQSNLFIEKNYEHRFYNFLSNTFFYGNKQNLESMPKIADELKSRTAIQNLSRSRSRAKEEFGKESKYERKPSGRIEIYASDPVYSDRRREDEDEKRSNFSRKSSKRGLKAPRKEIIGINTFSSKSPQSYLHFFQHDDNILHYLDLEEGTQFQPIPIKIDHTLPDFHKSISVSTGQLFLIGGAQANAAERKSPNIYKFDFQNNSLNLVNKLKFGRSSHSICFNNRYIYILGGYLNNQVLTNRCERYDIVSNRVEQIRPMLYESCSFACCSFSGRYIYKFGGVGQNNEIIHNIERFDQKTSMWEQVNPILDFPKGQSIIPLSTQAAVQITKQQIMVLGGYDENNLGYKQTFILKVEDNGNTSIRDVNVYPLPVAEGFWNSNPIVHKRMVFALQNVSTGQNDCSESVRRILSFDGSAWKQL